MIKRIVCILPFICIFMLAGCGKDAAQQDIKQTDEANVQEWVDYLHGKDMPWDGHSDLEVTEYPDVTFRWTPDRVTAIESGKEKILFEGMPVWNVFLTDLNGDDLPEFCSTVSIGSGIIDQRIVVYDYAAGKMYELSDRETFDYTLTMQDNQLIVTKSNYNASCSGVETVTGTLTLSATKESPKTAVLSMEVH